MSLFKWAMSGVIMVILAWIIFFGKESFQNQIYWPLYSFLILFVIFAFIFYRFERQGITTKEIAIVASMATLAAISRIPFAAIMSLQPTTFIVMISGYVFGPQLGFMVGALAAFVSNLFLGQGPWTPWQMFCWGGCGLIAGFISKKDVFKYKTFLAVTFFCGYLFGWIMNIWHWLGFVYPLNLTTFIATYLSSLPFDTLHAVGNLVFAIVFGKPFFSILKRFRNKIRLTTL